MDKIINKFGDALKSASKEERESFKEGFIKAQKEFLKKAPTPEDFLKIIDGLKDISEEEREKLKTNFAERLLNADKVKDVFSQRKSMEISSMDYVVFIGMVALIVFVIGFFGYKLYLSIMAKEMKREKKTRKQLKEEKKTQSPPASPRSKKEL